MTEDIAGNSRSAASHSWRRALEMTAPIAQHPSVTFPVVIERLADRFGDAPALLSDRQTLSYRELAGRAEYYARWALDQDVAPGDVVCLMMSNCPEYLAIWLGITKIGGVVALINTNLSGDALRHAIDIVRPRYVIVASGLSDAVAAVLPRLQNPVTAWAHGDARDWPRIDRYVPTAALDRADRAPMLSDRALYIYTSGTTGLPKAASVSHDRVMQWTHWFAGLIGALPEDRMYNCLPMYHSIGGVVATGAVLVGGGSVFVRERFSTSQFWDDIVGWDCTLFQYIGELCRYLVNAPSHPHEQAHRLRLACGNGLRTDVWAPFQDRFQIPRIIEYYAATESNFSLYNCDGKPGAIGRIPAYLAHRFSVALIKFDTDAGDIVRGADGFCVRCIADEMGEAISKLSHDHSGAGAGGRFEGYTDSQASGQKILRDVFSTGDAWYRTGDLMRKDRSGYFYFVDRIGDTFRWKGENISTAQVEETISGCPGVVEAVVYGVAVPGADGRAGMAALVTDAEFCLATFTDHLAARLPEYARPLFLRKCLQIASTGTFKPQKQVLARESFDPDASGDPLYFFDRGRNGFVPLDADLFDRIGRGVQRL